MHQNHVNQDFSFLFFLLFGGGRGGGGGGLRFNILFIKSKLQNRCLREQVGWIIISKYYRKKYMHMTPGQRFTCKIS